MHNRSNKTEKGSEEGVKSIPKKELSKSGENDDWQGLIPISVTTILTLLTLYLTYPSTDQWSSPLDHDSKFVGWQWGTPPASPIYTGRQEELNRLSNLMASPNARVCVFGPSGSGKRELVINYLSKAAQNYSVVIWLNAESESHILADIQVLVNTLQLRLLYEDHLPEEWFPHHPKRVPTRIALLRAFHAWLYKQRNYLIIFDHAGTSEELSSSAWLDYFVPKFGGNLLYLAPYRIKSVPSSLEVSNLKEEEAIELFSTLSPTNAQDAAKIIKKTSSSNLSPLSISILAKLLQYHNQPKIKSNDMNQNPIDILLSRLDAKHKQLLLFASLFANGFPSYLLSPWETDAGIVLDYLEERGLVRQQPCLQPLVSCVYIPRAIRKAIAHQVVVDSNLAHDNDPKLTFHMLAQQALQILSLEIQQKHIIKDHVPPGSELQASLLPSTYPLPYDAIPPRAYGVASLVQSILSVTPHYNASLPLTPHTNSTMLWWLFHHTAHYLLYAHNNTHTAFQFYELAYHTLHKELPTKGGSTEVSRNTAYRHIHALSYLATAATARGAGRAGARLHQQALELSLQLGEQHPLVADIHINIGDGLAHAKQYNDALDAYNKAIQVDRKLYGDQHLTVSRDLLRIAFVYQLRGEWDKALSTIQVVFDTYIFMFGDKHQSVADLCDWMGVLWARTGRTRQAVGSFQRAQSIWKKQLDGLHPRFALNTALLASMYQALAWEKQARRMYIQAINIEVEAAGEVQPLVLQHIISLSDLEYSLGKYQESLTTLHRAVTIANRLYSPHEQQSRELRLKALRLSRIVGMIKAQKGEPVATSSGNTLEGGVDLEEGGISVSAADVAAEYARIKEREKLREKQEDV